MSKILLAIPSKNQVAYLDKMVAALEAQKRVPDRVLYLLDRPSGVERITASRRLSGHPFIELMCISDEPEYIGRPTMEPGVDNFLTGRVREHAIDYMMANGYDCIVFLDGDCIPEENFTKDHLSVLDTSNPCTTVGKRKEAAFGWDDQRSASTLSAIHIFKDSNFKVTTEAFFVDSGIVWTCNFGMNIAAVNTLRKLNLTLYGREEVFPSSFLGTWGGEDGFIGLECLYSGIDVIALKENMNGIRHIDHPRPGNKYNHIHFINYLESHREELLELMRLHNYNVPKFKPRVDLLAEAGIMH